MPYSVAAVALWTKVYGLRVEAVAAAKAGVSVSVPDLRWNPVVLDHGEVDSVMNKEPKPKEW